MSQIILDKSIAPSAPSVGSVALYVKSDNILYSKTDGGIESPVGGITSISSLTSIDNIDFDTETAIPSVAGRLTWNDTDGTLNLGLKGGNTTLQIGQEQLVRVYNNSGSTMTDMQVIRITGSQGQRLTASLAIANNESLSDTTFAVVTESIGNNTEGFATVSGLVRDLNTVAFAEGATLYLSPTVLGGITSTKPVAPNHVVIIGWCVRSHSTVGSIFVNVQVGFEISELHDVLTNGKTNNDLLVWESATSVWKNKQLSVLTNIPPVTKTANYVILNTDSTIRADAASNNVTLTLPDSTVNIGLKLNIKRIDASVNKVYLNTILSQTIDGSTSVQINNQYTNLTIQSYGAGWDII